jgi:hypothetical protein
MSFPPEQSSGRLGFRAATAHVLFPDCLVQVTARLIEEDCSLTVSLRQLGEPARPPSDQLFISIFRSNSLWPRRQRRGSFSGKLFGLMSRSGTDSPYRPSPNEERCNRLVPHSEPSPRSSMRFSSETVREPSMSSYLLRGIPRTSSAIWRVLDKGYTLRSVKLLRNPALNPNRGRRVVSPSGATAVPTPLFARLSRVSPPLIIWPRAILELPSSVATVARVRL